MSPSARMRGALPLLLAVALAAAGCAGEAPPARVARHWIAGAAEPAFDPDGPPHALRWALERLLSRGLFELDSAGRARPAAAESVAVSADGRAWTFRLREGLRFTDGSPATSADFRAALLGGLGREDHATRAWQLAALAGADRVRAGRPLPPLGIETPDPRTLVLRLAVPDSLLPLKLALPGASTPWKRRTWLPWSAAVGIGPYRAAGGEPGRSLLLVRADSAGFTDAGPDTVHVRFAPGAPRVRSLLRQGLGDLAWPVPPAFLGQAPPAGYRVATEPADPVRRLLLVLRADVPPTTKPAARLALAHALNRETVLEALRGRGSEVGEWLPGAGPFEFPRLDAALSQEWLARGKLGASVHVVLAYDADLAGGEVARALQGDWARLGFYAELRGQRGAAALAEPLRAAAAQAQLVEAQALLPGLAGELAGLVLPLRGPAVGAFRTGWRTREFDPWILPGKPAGPLDPAAVQSRLAGDRIVLPLADLPWVWIEREDAPPVRVSPRYGPECSGSAGRAAPAQGSR